MQKLDIKLVKEAKKEKIKKLEDEMKDIILSHNVGEIFICPFCNYSGYKKNGKGSAKLFSDNKNKFFKCFNCGIWRKI